MTAANGSFAIRLPGFLDKMFGIRNLTYIADPDKGITYLTFAPLINPAAAVDETESNEETASSGDNSSDEETDSSDD